MDIDTLLPAIKSSLSKSDREQLAAQIRGQVQLLMEQNFERLVQLLYQVDIDEGKLRTLLRQQPETDAAEWITTLIIERQLQKEYTRSQFRLDVEDAEERW